jgi:hypothetical protein
VVTPEGIVRFGLWVVFFRLSVMGCGLWPRMHEIIKFQCWNSKFQNFGAQLLLQHDIFKSFNF